MSSTPPEQPKLKPFFTKMREEIAVRLHIEPQQVSIQGKTYEGNGVIGRQEGIEVRSLVALLLENYEDISSNGKPFTGKPI
jgi:2-C-methyl-D-erythritol 2,4-cyclodiphosphate synthase